MPRSLTGPFSFQAALALLAPVVIHLGCKSTTDSKVEKEVFYGRFIYEHDPHFVGGIDTDLVKFTIEGTEYSIVFSTFRTKICSSGGKAYDFGTNTVTLVPQIRLSANCDTIHIPRGIFSSRFVGDSVYLLRFDTAAAKGYRFELAK